MKQRRKREGEVGGMDETRRRRKKEKKERKRLTIWEMIGYKKI